MRSHSPNLLQHLTNEQKSIFSLKFFLLLICCYIYLTNKEMSGWILSSFSPSLWHLYGLFYLSLLLLLMTKRSKDPRSIKTGS